MHARCSNTAAGGANTGALDRLAAWKREANLSERAPSVDLSLSFYASVQPVELLGGTRFRRIGSGPYSLTLGPYGVFWLLLSRRAVRPTPSSDIEAGVLATRPEAREAPAAIASVGWERRDWQQER